MYLITLNYNIMSLIKDLERICLKHIRKAEYDKAKDIKNSIAFLKLNWDKVPTELVCNLPKYWWLLKEHGYNSNFNYKNKL